MLLCFFCFFAALLLCFFASLLLCCFASKTRNHDGMMVRSLQLSLGCPTHFMVAKNQHSQKSFKGSAAVRSTSIYIYIHIFCILFKLLVHWFVYWFGLYQAYMNYFTSSHTNTTFPQHDVHNIFANSLAELTQAPKL